MQWRIECKHSGAGHDFEGGFGEALENAADQCTTDTCRWVVWAEPANVRMAEVMRRGAVWIRTILGGQEVVTLMRRHKKTIAGLAFTMALTQTHIRKVRERGLVDPNAVRDWLEAITDEDPGPLPERYRISGIHQEADCGYCGCPLMTGDTAYEYAMGVFCSVSCSRESRRLAKGAAHV